MKKAIITLLILIAAVNPAGAYGAAFNICRIDETGTIIGGPVNVDSQAGVICKVSEAGYVYTCDEYDLRCFDNGLNLVNEVNLVSDIALSIDNTRNEVIIVNDFGNIARYDPTLNLLDELEVSPYPHYLTVDESDGSLWYTGGTYYWEYGLRKLTRGGDELYYFPDKPYNSLTTVTPSGNFWACSYRRDVVKRMVLSDSFANIIIETLGIKGWNLRMYTTDESCWYLSHEPLGVGKVNSIGAVVYFNCTNFDRPYDLAIDQDDGSVWIADTYNYDIVHLDQNGGELLRTDWDWVARAIAVDPADGTVIVVSSRGDVSIEPTSLGEVKAMFR